MSEILQRILRRIEAVNQFNSDKLRAQFDEADPECLERASAFFERYDAAMAPGGKSIEFGVDCYLTLLDDMLEERKAFVRSGQYANSSYKEVEQRIYGNPEVMTYHMHGLALAQFLWPDQYKRFLFFARALPSYREKVRSYLEIGGGHGLYAAEADAVLAPETKIDLIDISESSIALARRLIGSSRIQYIHCDLFEFEPGRKYDFITMGEIIEHVENPAEMLSRVHELLADDGTVYLTTPVNAPMIDHIYLFRTVQEIRSLLTEAKFDIETEKYVITENVSEEVAQKRRIPIMYAAFLKKGA